MSRKIRFLLIVCFVFMACDKTSQIGKEKKDKLSLMEMELDEKEKIEESEKLPNEWANAVQDKVIIDNYIKSIGAYKIFSIEGNYTNSGGNEYLLILDLNYNSETSFGDAFIDSIRCLIINDNGKSKNIKILDVADVDSYCLSDSKRKVFDNYNIPSHFKQMTNGWTGDFCGLGTEQIFFYSAMASNYSLSIFTFNGKQFQNVFEDDYLTDDIFIVDMDEENKSFIYRKTDLNENRLLKKAVWDPEKFCFEISYNNPNGTESFEKQSRVVASNNYRTVNSNWEEIEKIFSEVYIEYKIDYYQDTPLISELYYYGITKGGDTVLLGSYTKETGLLNSNGQEFAGDREFRTGNDFYKERLLGLSVRTIDFPISLKGMALSTDNEVYETETLCRLAINCDEMTIEEWFPDL